MSQLGISSNNLSGEIFSDFFKNWPELVSLQLQNTHNMTEAMEILVNKVEQSKLTAYNLQNLAFGKYFTDHMLEADYENGEWKNVEIKPYQPILFDPSICSAF